MNRPERAQQLDIPGLRWTAGAPEPRVVASERRTLFGYYVPDGDADTGEVRVAEFVGCTSVRFGSPSDETLNGHPLYGHGLQFCAAHEVIGSSWLSEVRRMESTHPRALPHPLPEARHFLLAFHDSTLEAIARDVVVLEAFESMAEAMAWMAATATRV
jgi:hypothetical protein